jgi:hypothetical protein
MTPRAPPSPTVGMLDHRQQIVQFSTTSDEMICRQSLPPDAARTGQIRPLAASKEDH